MMTNEVVRKLRERYSGIHPTMFARSLERAYSLGSLFDILDTFPTEFPIKWDAAEKRWAHTKDLLPR